ncbi:MAG: tRNA (guanosine(18)-2'-O)-methyltransferase TrmH [Acidobacteriota bacterium]
MTTPERFARVREVLDRRQPDLTVLLENVHKPHNFSAILRSCDAVGICEAHAITPTGDRPKLHNAVTSGAGKWLKVRSHDNIQHALGALKAEEFQVLAAHPAEGAIDYRQADFTRPTAVLLGQEKDGVSVNAAAGADGWIVIPMFGMVPSLNVSVAAALILFEAQRQRAAAGLYDRCRLDPEVYRRTLFEWAYPVLAERCRRHKVDYPELGEDGDLLGDVPRG